MFSKKLIHSLIHSKHYTDGSSCSDSVMMLSFTFLQCNGEAITIEQQHHTTCSPDTSDICSVDEHNSFSQFTEALSDNSAEIEAALWFLHDAICDSYIQHCTVMSTSIDCWWSAMFVYKEVHHAALKLEGTGLLFRFSVIETIVYTFTTISWHFLLYWEEAAELRVDLMMIIEALQKGG